MNNVLILTTILSGLLSIGSSNSLGKSCSFGTSPGQVVDTAAPSIPPRSDLPTPARQIKPTPSQIPQKPSPTGALLRSVALPGWGQIYNHKYIKAVIIGGAEIAFVTGVAVQNERLKDSRRKFDQLLDSGANPSAIALEQQNIQFYENTRNTFIWLTAGAIFYSMLDAYVDAHLAQYDQSDLPPLSLQYEPDRQLLRIVCTLVFR